MGECGVELSGLGQGQLASSSEHSNENIGSIKYEELLE